MTQTIPAAAVPLWPEVPPQFNADDGFVPYIDVFTVATLKPKGAVLIFPGGGYNHRADHEGAPVAEAFNNAGCHAFVVQYRVAPNRHPVPLLDAARAVRLVRCRADEWKIRTDRIAVLGFSAGGHLAGSISVLHREVPAAVDDVVEALSCRPDASILCYPVTSCGEHGHRGSFDSLLGPTATPEQRRALSLEIRVDPNTPPAFLWHTAADAGVPVENSLLYASALRRCGIPFELHVYPEGHHGLGLAPEQPHVATWSGLAAEWLQEMGW